jgi:hypothetical protein
MSDETTPQSGHDDAEGHVAKAKVSRRTFSALVGTGVAMLLPRAADARDLVEGEADVQAPASRRPGGATGGPTRQSPVIKTFSPPRPAKDAEHAIVYRREDEFASHPYVSGFWETAAGHLVANFSTRKVDYVGDPNNLSHNNLGRNPGGRGVTVRSEDRGRTWKEIPAANDVSAPQSRADGAPDSLAEIGPIDFTNKDVLVANSSTAFGAPESRSFVRVSKDAGRSWSRSFMLPLDGLHSLSAINSVLVRPDGRCLLFMFEVSKDGWNRHNLVYRSTDDGTSFHFMSFITPKDDPFAAGSGDFKPPYAFGGHRWFYPRGYLLPSGRILCVLRSQRDPTSVMWTELYKSDDGGQTWQFLSRVNDFGAPGSLVRMRDGRLVIVYGYRLPPFGIRAVVSEDEGVTWGSEIVVRDDGGSWDLGYPNAWEAAPGRIGVLYYFNSKTDPVQVKPGGSLAGAGGVRHIARSIFSVT